MRGDGSIVASKYSSKQITINPLAKNDSITDWLTSKLKCCTIMYSDLVQYNKFENEIIGKKWEELKNSDKFQQTN